MYRPPLDKPFDLNKKEIAKKAEYHLEDLKTQYYEVWNDQTMTKIGQDSYQTTENIKAEIAELIKREEAEAPEEAEEANYTIKVTDNC